jgi:YVTN family beta-propeller protein
LDSKTGAIVGRIEGMPGGTHGIAVVHSLNKGYTDDGRAGEIVAFDLDTLKVVARIKGQADADGIVFDSKTQRIFVINGESANLTVVDPRTDRVVATVQVGGGLEFAVADGQGKLFVNGEARREVVRIDTQSLAVDARWPIPGCESPHGMAMDPLARRLFVSCRNEVATVVDANSGAVITTVPIGRGTDDAAFDPQRQLIFSSNGLDGTVSVIKQESPTRYRNVGEIVTALTGRTMAIDPDSGRLYVAAASAKPAMPAATAAPGTAGRAQIEPGSLKIYFIDPR